MRFIFYFTIIFILLGCSAATISNTHFTLQKGSTIAIVPFENYTDTPQAGFKAANLMEGVLLSKGYGVINLMNEKTKNSTLLEKLKLAKRYNANYLLYGGVSEWRYKIGMDAQPAVSLSLKAIDVRSHTIAWSATGSDSSGGNDSIGEIAQKLFQEILNKR